MKPFILLQVRPEDAAADNEYETFSKFSRLGPDELLRFRLHNGEVPDLDLNTVPGIFLGGGPYNVSDPEKAKSPAQKKFEANFAPLLNRIVDTDSPFLAACGIGLLIKSQQGVVSRKYGEPVGATLVQLTAAGRRDKLLKNLPDKFEAFGGHKEACEILPPQATLLAGSKDCPAQIFKFGHNVTLLNFTVN